MDILAILKNVFTPGYIFDFSAMTLTQGDRVYMIAGLLMVLLGAGFKLMSNFSKDPVTKRLWHRFASPLVVGGILEVLWYALREQNIKLFGSHFAAWAIIIVILVVLYFPARYWLSRYKEDRQKWEKQQVKLKYIK